jgi:hypothetical protein
LPRFLEDDVQGGKEQYSSALLDLLFTVCDAVGDPRKFFKMEKTEDSKKKPTLIAPPVADASEALL